MTGQRWILHVDLDQFQAAVEVRRKPQLRDQPVVVGGTGDPRQPRKVVTCASYEARAYGVRAGMPLAAAAQKCPQAVFLPLDHPAYQAASEQVMDVLRELTNAVEVWGLDEAFVAVSAPSPEAFAVDIRRAVAATTGLSCSVGIGVNKSGAKLASGLAKPAGVFRLDETNWSEVMAGRPVDALWGVGPKTARKLVAAGLSTVGELAAADLGWLVERFGSAGRWLHGLASGRGDTEVSAAPRVPRSRSRVRTFPEDLVDPAVMEERVVELAAGLLAEVVAEGRSVQRVAVTVRTSSFHTSSKVRTLPAVTVDTAAVTAGARRVFGLFELTRPVRLLGVRFDLADIEDQ